MPNHVYNILTVTGDSRLVERLDKAVRSNDEQPFDFNRIVPRPPIVDDTCCGDLDTETESQNPNRNWYAWNINHWGTKWNAYDFKQAEFGTYEFYTAWDPPFPVVEALAELFPELRIQIDYREKGFESSGSVCFENGQALSDS